MLASMKHASKSCVLLSVDNLFCSFDVVGKKVLRNFLSADSIVDHISGATAVLFAAIPDLDDFRSRRHIRHLVVEKYTFFQ